MKQCSISGSSDVGAYDLRTTSLTTTSAMVCFTWGNAGAGHSRAAGCVAVGWTGTLLMLEDELGPHPIVSTILNDIHSDNQNVMGTSLNAFTDVTTDGLNSTSRAVYCYESKITEDGGHWLGKNLTCVVLSVSMTEIPPELTCKIFFFFEKVFFFFFFQYFLFLGSYNNFLPFFKIFS